MPQLHVQCRADRGESRSKSQGGRRAGGGRMEVAHMPIGYSFSLLGGFAAPGCPSAGMVIYEKAISTASCLLYVQ